MAVVVGIAMRQGWVKVNFRQGALKAVGAVFDGMGSASIGSPISLCNEKRK